ncbi:MAG: hypothetical protein RI897_2339 [Verrucomicrobiota bacterium]
MGDFEVVRDAEDDLLEAGGGGKAFEAATGLADEFEGGEEAEIFVAFTDFVDGEGLGGFPGEADFEVGSAWEEGGVLVGVDLADAGIASGVLEFAEDLFEGEEDPGFGEDEFSFDFALDFDFPAGLGEEVIVGDLGG